MSAFSNFLGLLNFIIDLFNQIHGTFLGLFEFFTTPIAIIVSDFVLDSVFPDFILDFLSPFTTSALNAIFGDGASLLGVILGNGLVILLTWWIVKWALDIV